MVLNNLHKTLLISPHSDDVAFSIGGVILNGFIKDPHVITVFSVSSCTETDLDYPVDVITKMRKQEDISFFQPGEKGIRVTYMDMLDAPLRLGIKEEEVFSFSEGCCNESKFIADTIKMKCNPDTLLFVPFAIGGHIDHLIVRDAAIILAEEGYPVAFYEDLPYSGDSTNKDIDVYKAGIEIEKKIKLSEITVKLRDAFDLKTQKIGAYESQISDSILKRIKNHGINIGSGEPAERIWANEKAYEMLPIKLTQ